MHPIASRFQLLELTPAEDLKARQASSYFFGYLQNKIAARANAIVEFRYDGKEQAAAILEHEVLKAQVAVLEELMAELIPPGEITEQSANPA